MSQEKKNFTQNDAIFLLGRSHPYSSAMFPDHTLVEVPHHSFVKVAGDIDEALNYNGIHLENDGKGAFNHSAPRANPIFHQGTLEYCARMSAEEARKIYSQQKSAEHLFDDPEFKPLPIVTDAEHLGTAKVIELTKEPTALAQ